MIVQVSQKIFVANDSKRLSAAVDLIRAEKLFHVCTRFVKNNREFYITDLVAFNYNSGNYYCININCNKVVPIADMLQDPVGTGWEGHA